MSSGSRINVDVWPLTPKRARELGSHGSTPPSVDPKALAFVVIVGIGHFNWHRSRYRLLFSDPAIAAQKGELEKTAFAAFAEFIGIVQECQAAQSLPDVPKTTLAGLLFATMHGLIALEASGRMHAEKGLSSVQSGLETLVDLLSPETH